MLKTMMTYLAAALLAISCGSEGEKPSDGSLKVGYVVNFMSHEWYQNICKAAQRHAENSDVDLIIADARLLHAAWPNQTAQRRTLVLAWHGVFSFPQPPSWWTGEVPEAIRNFDPQFTSAGTRKPSHHLQ